MRLIATHWRVLAVAFIAAIWVASLVPQVDLPSFHFRHADKIEHFFSYGILGYLLVRGWPRAAWWLLWLVALLCGGAAEVGQALFTTSRHPDWWDMLANLMGAGAGLLAGKLTLYWERSRD